jgi:hypothetical protein
MKRVWFRRWGWIHRPVLPAGWAATLLALAFCARGISRDSSSPGGALRSGYRRLSKRRGGTARAIPPHLL